MKMKPAHPGSILREDILQAMDISITKAAENLQVSRKLLSEIVNESAAITPQMAYRLEKGFGVEAKFWLDIQANYDLWKVKNSSKKLSIRRITA